MNENVESWLTCARVDLQVAELLLEKEIYAQSCFHTQQCIEKVLKALLIHYQCHMPPRTHVTMDLLSLLPSEWFTDVETDLLEKIDDYYVVTRYPDAFPEVLPEGLPVKSDAEEALAVARIVFERARKLIQSSAK